ncbi:MAG: glucuronate isomerase, partial [Prolixibacteraceae bacterium]|nr:glucuronate isomerase [Prolixibacteraceae bacterium]
MKTFMDENFMLQSEAAKRLYHDYAAQMPIIDYHNHLPPHEISGNVNFKNLAQIWLYGDHYKWRAMRANGVDEALITGNASDYEKFEKWSETVPYTLRNPLYHWTHLELQRYFGIDELLNPKTARSIYERTEVMLQQPDFSVQSLLTRMNVETLCTTDDPADDLAEHLKITRSDFKVKVLPTWRPDKAMAVENPVQFKAYLEKLGQAANMEITSVQDLIDALQKRHDFFHEAGCRISDHGIETFYAEDFTLQEIEEIFKKVRKGKLLSPKKILQFKSFMLLEGAKMDHASGWAQQFHYGVLRNNNSRMFTQLGPDTGFDSIGDFQSAKAMVRFFNELERTDQ